MDVLTLISNDTVFIKLQQCSNLNPEQNSFLQDILKNSTTILIGLIAGMIALYQVKSNVISSARIKWIDELRSNLSELYSITLETVINNVNARIGKTDEIKTIYYDKYITCLSRFLILSNKVKMHLNSNEDKHHRIELLIDEIVDLFDSNNIDSINKGLIENKLKEIVKISKQIFREEWKRSKKILNI